MDVAALLVGWVRHQPQFVVGGNEAGMVLGGDVRAADVAVWRRADVGPPTGRFRRAAPVLAVEVAGQEEGESELRAKARWYLDRGVEVVWLVLPELRSVIVITNAGETRHGTGERLSEQPTLPGLAALVDDFFIQLAR